MHSIDVHVTIPARHLKEPIETYLFDRCNSYAYGIETGKTGFIHYQVYANITPPTTATDDIPQGVVDTQYMRTLFYPYHVELARAGYDYVLKDGCYFCSWMKCNYNFNYAQSIIVSCMRDYFDDPDVNDRVVLNFIDLKGGFGKTFMSRIMEELCIAVRVPQMPHDKLSAYLIDRPKYGFYVFDLTRVDSGKKNENLFSVIEELKNGKLSDWRYKGREWNYELGRPIHVVLFSNKKINTAYLSEDRIQNIFIDDIPFMQR